MEFVAGEIDKLINSIYDAIHTGDTKKLDAFEEDFATRISPLILNLVDMLQSRKGYLHYLYFLNDVVIPQYGAAIDAYKKMVKNKMGKQNNKMGGTRTRKISKKRKMRTHS